MADLPGFDQSLHGAGDVLDGDGGVDAVLVEQVDGVGPQALERPVDGGADVVRSARDPGLPALLVETEAELRGDDDLLADRCERLTEQFLVVDRPVDLGGAEEGDATDDCRTKRKATISSCGGVGPKEWLIPMQPRPRGETWRPGVPSVRGCICQLLLVVVVASRDTTAARRG